MAGSEMGGRLSEDDAGYSMDGRFSCSSLYSEFGHVASHLEERHPGLVLARQASDHKISHFCELMFPHACPGCRPILHDPFQQSHRSGICLLAAWLVCNRGTGL